MASVELMRLAQEAMRAIGRRDFAGAQRIARQMLLQNPRDANANQLLGIAALETGDPATAKKFLERADQAAPGQPLILNTLGVALDKLGELDGARRAFKRAGELGLVDGWRNLGDLEHNARNADLSIAIYQRALKLAPNDAAAHAALAQAYEVRHDLAQAKTHAIAAMKADQNSEIARLALGNVLLREKEFANAEIVVAPLVRAAGGSKNNQALAWGVIGEARDREGDTHSAFQAFTAANRILLEQNGALLSATHLLYHPAGVREMTDLVEAANVAAWDIPAAFDTPAPVFLVGFPRSGTTLLDQILSSHSGIVCMEEREHFANALAGVISDKARLAKFESLSAGEIEAVRAEYWARVKEGMGALPNALLVDKLPLNIVVLPLIKRVFPDAKIIFALRDPRDVILSCYQQRFGMNAAMAQFLELNSAAAYYDAMMRLMERCRARLDLNLHQVRYEDVVADLETAARALTAFLGVDYEPAMLSFSDTARKKVIYTPSARQVTQPLYARSVGRWRRYADNLAPILPVLAPWAERFGYPP